MPELAASASATAKLRCLDIYAIYSSNYIAMATKTSGAHIRVTLRKGAAFGPGKAQLLEGIRDTGSIAAAGRRMKMSYSRAWGLVEEMNTQFRGPLGASAKGGAAHV